MNFPKTKSLAVIAASVVLTLACGSAKFNGKKGSNNRDANPVTPQPCEVTNTCPPPPPPGECKPGETECPKPCTGADCPPPPQDCKVGDLTCTPQPPVCTDSKDKDCVPAPCDPKKSVCNPPPPPPVCDPKKQDCDDDPGQTDDGDCSVQNGGKCPHQSH
jgi:hypothetical protein